MSTADFQREAEFFARLPGRQIALNDEYYRVFGHDAPPVNWDAVVDSAKSTFGKDPNPLKAAFYGMYKIPEKRAEIEAATRKKEIEEAEKRGGESMRSKMLAENPELSGRTVTRERQGSPILDRGRAQQKELEKTGKLPERDHSQRDTVSAAVAAYNDGKYRQDGKSA